MSGAFSLAEAQRALGPGWLERHGFRVVETEFVRNFDEVLVLPDQLEVMIPRGAAAELAHLQHLVSVRLLAALDRRRLYVDLAARLGLRDYVPPALPRSP